jgi:hypothetical protein
MADNKDNLLSQEGAGSPNKELKMIFLNTKDNIPVFYGDIMRVQLQLNLFMTEY